jgi:predicted site-specific integrase-resolvase
LKIREVAVQAGTTLTHIYNWVRSERLPGAFKADGEWHVPEATVQSYLERRRKGRSKATLPGAGAAA